MKPASNRNVAAEMVPAELPSGIVGTPDRPLPAFARLDGRIVLVIEMSEYRDLLIAASLNARSGLVACEPRREPTGLSTIERDPEVADFLRERFPRSETMATLHAACVARFGTERSPSFSRITTFRTRWRNAR